MSIQRTDSKFKRKKIKDDAVQRQYDTIVISKEKSQKAIDKFHEEPFQLQYQRMMKEHTVEAMDRFK